MTDQPALEHVCLDSPGDVERFIDRYWMGQQPVVIRGQELLAICSRLESIVERTNGLLERGAAQRILGGWVECESSDVLDGGGQPAIVAEVFRRTSCYPRPRACRIWFHGEGHVTPWHYDGYSTSGFNLLVDGEKDWSLIDPATTMRAYPLLPFSTSAFDANPRGHRCIRYRQQRGDMLYVPAYWWHRVEAVGKRNANINWVATRKDAPRWTSTARREAANITMLLFARRLLRFSSPYLDQYAGVGIAAAREIAGRARLADVVATTGRDIWNVPRLLWDARRMIDFIKRE